MKTYINDDKHICELTITETREIDGDIVIDTRVFKQATQALNALGKTITEISIHNVWIDFEVSCFKKVSESTINRIWQMSNHDDLSVHFKNNRFYAIVDDEEILLPTSILSCTHNDNTELLLILKYE